MSIAFLRNETLGVNLALYSGGVSIEEMKALAEFMAANPHHLRRDSLSLVEGDADFSSVSLGDLDALFARYKAIFASLPMQLFRRSAWICRSQQARAHVDYWVSGRDTRNAVTSDVRQFETIEHAGQWLALSPLEIAILESRSGFDELPWFAAGAQSARATG